MALAAGSLLTDNLRLVREIGHGAMGTVWVAEQLSLGCQVAVKVLRATVGVGSHEVGRGGPLGQEARERFAQEARRVAQIDSPHVVKILDYGVSEDGEQFIVMELLRGCDLGRWVDERGALSGEETADIVDQLCRALSAAHERGVVHRDIKPANVFISDNDGKPFVTLLDFGVAKAVGDRELSLTATGALMGTPYFMSPEQFMGRRDVDARSDLWSVAVLAYTCLTGKLPFRGDSVVVISMAAHAGVFQPPTRLQAGLSPAIDAWFARGFAVERADRFASARALADSFAAAVAGEAPPSLVDPMGSTAVARSDPPARELGASTGSGSGATGGRRRTGSARPGSTHGGLALSSAPASSIGLSPEPAAPARSSGLLYALGALALLGLLGSAVSITYIVAKSDAPQPRQPEPAPAPSPQPRAPTAEVPSAAPPITDAPPTVAPAPSPTASASVRATKPAAPPPIKWRERGTTCTRYDETKMCAACCNTAEGDRMTPYPACACVFDGEKWDREHGRAP